MMEVLLGERPVGRRHPCYVIAEIGINHNGDIDIAKKLIDVAAAGGLRRRQVPEAHGRRGLHAGGAGQAAREARSARPTATSSAASSSARTSTSEIDAYCRRKPIAWSASCWDEASVDFIDQFDPPCYKIASASLTDDDLLRHTRAKGKPIILSTGMSTLEQIDHAVEVLGKDDLVLLHTCSTYPAQYAELNLRVIPTLRERYGVPVGYSGHETGIASSVAAAALGACMVERHITLDRSMWGSDQAASLEPNGIMRLVRDIRLVETVDGRRREARAAVARCPIMQKLRRVGL